MRIGELAAQSGVPTSTIRFYEKRGLLPEAKRLTSGYRHYDEDNVKQLKLIRFAQDLGFSLDEVSGMVANSGVDHDRALNHLQDKLRELESLIERMTEKK
ncbi:MAG: MerR family transcriptional regulator, partial [Pseudomonadota bacterium]